MRSTFAKLVKQLRKRFPEANVDMVRRAYRVANEAHGNQTRLSGEPYIIHPLEVALNLAMLGLDPVTCAAGLLHDVLEDTKITRKELAANFGEDVAVLVDGVTKISGLHFGGEHITNEVKQAQNIRKMLVATAKDVRVILIKLADRLHNIRTISFLPKHKRERIARETLEIYAPLAHRLGIARWKWELEDHAFHELMPVEYKKTASHVAMRRRERESELHQITTFLETRLMEAEVIARVIGRPKHLYSIYQKMLQQGKDFHEVMDIVGIRIITQTEAGCYNALGVVHSLWMPVPGRLKDYIAMPKPNMYQSLHTTVMAPRGVPMEIQIRTEDMDRTAREGIAAHWTYKEGAKAQTKQLDGQLEWLRQMYEWLQDTQSAEEVIDNVRRDMKDQFIYAFTPKGEVKELPTGATPLDFAYTVHSAIGHQCIGAKVNGRLVPLRYHLQTGDVVEILTSKNQTPHLDWCEIVVTARARTRIRQRLREIGELDPADDPRAPHRPLQPVLRVRPTGIKPATVVDDATRQKLIRIDGKRGIQVQFAKCCNPMPGHPVIGYVTKSPGLTVHRADCKTFEKNSRDEARIMSAAWAGDRGDEVTFRVVIGPRPNVLADITAALRPTNVEILRAHFAPGENGKSFFDFMFETNDPAQINRVERMLRNVSGVTEVRDLGDATSIAQAG